MISKIAEWIGYIVMALAVIYILLLIACNIMQLCWYIWNKTMFKFWFRYNVLRNTFPTEKLRHIFIQLHRVKKLRYQIFMYRLRNIKNATNAD